MSEAERSGLVYDRRGRTAGEAQMSLDDHLATAAHIATGAAFDDGSGAWLSPCGAYRFVLWRMWAKGPRLNFVMLNPSTADAEVDDPTIRRCVGFAKREGYAGLYVTNLYALRATDPREIARHPSPEGFANDLEIQLYAALCERVVVAWGARGGARGPTVVRILVDVVGADNVLCLGTTKQGEPRHPLYVRGDAPLVPFPGYR